MRILIAQINFTVGSIAGNAQKILDAITRGREKGCQLAVFSELALTGYPPEDLLLLPHFIQEVEEILERIVKKTYGIGVILGLPRKNESSFGKRLFNSAAVVYDGKLIGFQDKTLLPTYDVFDEQRYFEKGKERKIFTLFGKKIAVTICEDIWQHAKEIKEINYAEDPIEDIKDQKIDLLVNLSASPFSTMNVKRRMQALQKAARTVQSRALLCNQVGGNDSLIFDGYSFVSDSLGRVIRLGKGFLEDYIVYDMQDNSQEVSLSFHREEEIYQALILGVRDYFHKQGFKKAVLGLSGGVDSALVACIAEEALGGENVFSVSMPSRFSSEGSVKDADLLVEALGIQKMTISIEKPFQAFLDLLEPHFEGLKSDVTEENLQARIRGVILMALSNKFGYIVLSTGNKSELAMGYSTLYGDLCGGLSVINDLTKRQVYQLAWWIHQKKGIIPKNTLIKPPSAELKENQKDIDSLPDYEIIDTVLEAYLYKHKSGKEIALENSLPLDLVESLIRRIHKSEYKRRQSPPGLRVTDKAFSIGRRFPIVQRWEI